MLTGKVREGEMLLLCSGEEGIGGERLQPGARSWRGAQAVPRPARGVFPSRSSGRVRPRCRELLETMQIPPAPTSGAFRPGLTACLHITMNLKAPA